MDPLSKPTVRLPHQLGLATFSARELEALVEVRNSTNALTLLPPASEGWGKVMFSVCSHLGGGQVQLPEGGSGPAAGGRSGPAAKGGQVQLLGGVRSSCRGGGSGPAAGGGSASCALLRAVCLLRSRRRTFLFHFAFSLWRRHICTHPGGPSGTSESAQLSHASLTFTHWTRVRDTYNNAETEN